MEGPWRRASWRVVMVRWNPYARATLCTAAGREP